MAKLAEIVKGEVPRIYQPLEKPHYSSSGSPSRAQKPAIAVF
jgi:hypothetical protein